MKELGKALVRAAEMYPIATIGVAAFVASNIAYNAFVLADRIAQYKILAKKQEKNPYYYD